MLGDWTYMDLYYLTNRFWIGFNILLILPFLFSCIVRFYNQRIDKYLWTDHCARVLLVICWIFYIWDILIKYPIDGAETICEKCLLIHHGASLFIMPPLFLNSYIPWWACPVGFMHGFALYFPESDMVSYIYAACLMVFHYGIYQEPYCHLKGYAFLRVAINFIWVFCLMLLLGNCSNYLPIGPD